MAAITTTQDGEYIYLALDDVATGFPVILRCARSSLAVFTSQYAPGAGAAANLTPDLSNPDRVLFYGNFGTNVTVLSHVPSTGAETDISPPGLGAQVVNCLAIDPNNPDEIWVTVDTANDLLRTLDGGSNWDTLTNALGFSATAMAINWGSEVEYHIGFVAGDNGADLDLLYTPNEGSEFDDYAGAGLGAQTNICGVEIGQEEFAE